MQTISSSPSFRTAAGSSRPNAVPTLTPDIELTPVLLSEGVARDVLRVVGANVRTQAAGAFDRPS